jgi:cysteine-rich repeat protein
LAVRHALAVCLLLASSTSLAAPHVPRLRDRTVEGTIPARARGGFVVLGQRGWRATWDRDTGVPAWMWGAYVDVPGAVGDPAIAERAARQFLAQHLELLAPGAREADFTVVANHIDAGVRSVGFTQTWRGVSVVGGGLGFVFANDRLFAISSAAWPHVTAQLATKTTAILPVVRAGAITYQAVGIDDAGDWRVYRDARGREVARESLVRHASATLRYNVPVRHPAGARADAAAPLVNLTANGVATTTAANGMFTWGGTGAATTLTSVTGTQIRITNQAGAPVTSSFTAQPNGTVTWNLATDEEGDAQLAAYIHASTAKARARIINPSVATWLDAPFDVFVNEPGPACNASATATAMHFAVKSATCENTARLADVVFHEFGHSLHDNSVIVGMGAFNAPLSEGLADFYAANLTDDPAVGRGIFFDESPMRDIDPLGIEHTPPEDFDSHVAGLIISGALWDLRKALIKQLGPAAGVARTERVFTGIMQRANAIGTSFVAALIADDDDGNLGNNTPNFCAIERAFGAHGLVPDHVTTRVAPPWVDGLELTMTVDTPTGTTCTPPAVSAITVTWRIGDGVPSTFDLVPDGATWRGTFPAQPDGTLVLYSIDVTYDDGSLQVFPNNQADPRYQLFVGNAVPIYCESFNDNPAWPQAGDMGFEWEWGAPVIGPAAGDPPGAFTGTNVLGTDLTGDGKYRPKFHVSTTMPAVTSHTYELVRLQYRRWLTVEDASYDQATVRVNNVEVWRNAQAPTKILDHVDREWRFHDIDLTPHVIDGTVEVQWTLATDDSKELGGWALDDVCIVGLQKIPTCGDGELDVKEQCDDGNTTDDDGCDHACVDEVTAGGGGCCEAGARSNGWLAALLLLVLRRRRC